MLGIIVPTHVFQNIHLGASGEWNFETFCVGGGDHCYQIHVFYNKKLCMLLTSDVSL